MESSDSFYHFDAFDSEFSDPKRNAVRVQTELLQGNEESVKFGDLGFYNEESIDLQQYLHLGNTPPNGNGDELLKQFGAYSSSPPVTVNVKSPVANTNTQALTQGLAGVSLATTNPKSQDSNIVNAAFSSTATITQLGFQIKQEVDEHSVPEFEHSVPEFEHSVPEFEQPIDMPPGEEQGMTIPKGDQGNLGGQQYYIQYINKSAGVAHNEDVVTSSLPGNHSYATVVDVNDPTISNDVDETLEVTSGAKKRHRPALNKESDEYRTKRHRNNVAVRKSREKSKAKNKDLQGKVTSLQTENEKLNKKVELLTKELTVLRSLFTTVKPTTNV